MSEFILSYALLYGKIKARSSALAKSRPDACPTCTSQDELRLKVEYQLRQYAFIVRQQKVQGPDVFAFVAYVNEGVTRVVGDARKKCCLYDKKCQTVLDNTCYYLICERWKKHFSFIITV